MYISCVASPTWSCIPRGRRRRRSNPVVSFSSSHHHIRIICTKSTSKLLRITLVRAISIATGSKSLNYYTAYPGYFGSVPQGPESGCCQCFSNMVNPSSSSSSSVVVVVFGLCKADIISMFDIASVKHVLLIPIQIWPFVIFRLSFVDAVVVVNLLLCFYLL